MYCYTVTDDGGGHRVQYCSYSEEVLEGKSSTSNQSPSKCDLPLGEDVEKKFCKTGRQFGVMTVCSW